MGILDKVMFWRKKDEFADVGLGDKENLAFGDNFNAAPGTGLGPSPDLGRDLGRGPGMGSGLGQQPNYPSPQPSMPPPAPVAAIVSPPESKIVLGIVTR